MRIIYFLLLALASIRSSQGQCSGSTLTLIATTAKQNLTGPTFPANYAPSTSCSWLITPSPGLDKLHLQINAFGTETSTSCGTSDDWVVIVDGSNRASGFQKACLTGTYATLQGQGLTSMSTDINNMWFIEFSSDSDGNVGTGFNMDFWAEDTSSSPALSTLAIILIAVGGTVLIIIVIIIVAVVVWKKKKQRIEELEWEYDSDDSYYYYTDSEYEEDITEGGAEHPQPSHPAPLPAGTVVGARAANVPGQPDYKAPGKLPPLNGVDMEKARRRRRRRIKKVKREKTKIGNGRASTDGSVVTASAVQVENEKKDDLEALEEEIMNEDNKQTTIPEEGSHPNGTSDPVFDNPNFSPAKG